MGEALPDVIRWISWGYWNFVRACDQFHFERATKQRYRLGPVRPDVVEEGLKEFASSAAILEQHLSARDWLVGERPTYADFRVGCVLPFADVAGLPVRDFPRVDAWRARLTEIPAWRDPFAGLDAPNCRRSRPAAGEPPGGAKGRAEIPADPLSTGRAKRSPSAGAFDREGGRSPDMFANVLIANRGEIACRIIRTARGMGMRSIALHTPADRGALFTRLADEAHEIGEGANGYLDQAAILALARKPSAPNVCIQATDFCPRTPISPKPARRLASFSSGPQPRRCGRWA